MRLTDLPRELRARLDERVGSPFFFWALAIWVSLNWKVLLIAISAEPLNERLALIDAELAAWKGLGAPVIGGMVAPIIAGVLSSGATIGSEIVQRRTRETVLRLRREAAMSREEAAAAADLILELRKALDEQRLAGARVRLPQGRSESGGEADEVQIGELEGMSLKAAHKILEGCMEHGSMPSSPGSELDLINFGVELGIGEDEVDLPSARSLYLVAIQELEDRGYVRLNPHQRYELTHEGRKLALLSRPSAVSPF